MRSKSKLVILPRATSVKKAFPCAQVFFTGALLAGNAYAQVTPTPATTVAPTPVATASPIVVGTPSPIRTIVGTPAAINGRLTAEGISGDLDREGRGPRFSFSTELSDENVAKILVSGQVPNEEYQKYPIQYEFYINNRLFSSQIYSEELSGPIGIEVGPQEAQVPFNYSIVAHVLHPNRRFSSVAFGAITEATKLTPLPSETPEAGGTVSPNVTPVSTAPVLLNCNVEYSEGDQGDLLGYSADQASFTQTASQITSSFTAIGTESTSGNLTLSLNLSSREMTSASGGLDGSVTVTKASGSPATIQVVGEFTMENGIISELTVGDDNATLDVICGDGPTTEVQRFIDRAIR
jgi:hypothetical protein